MSYEWENNLYFFVVLNMMFYGWENNLGFFLGLNAFFMVLDMIFDFESKSF